MAAFMKSLGCRRAMLLDGGLSSQLAVRGASGVTQWKNWRAVPLGLIASPVAP
jgi:exopolysaccharide biosynthesis protein